MRFKEEDGIRPGNGSLRLDNGNRRKVALMLISIDTALAGCM
jgi:hypothetical protein